MRTISSRKQAEIDAKQNSPFEVGERISVREVVIYPEYKTYKSHDQEKTTDCTILEVLGDEIKIIVGDGSYHKKTAVIKKDDVSGRDMWQVGENPFDKRKDSVRPVAFTLESVLFGLDIFGEKGDRTQMSGVPVLECNWNPFVYNKKGEKEYYQRPFVWTIEDKQLLIESIYRGIDCGRILVRKRGWNELQKMAATGETELAFNDIVDGKQRLNTIRGFMLDEFTDSQGNHFSDLSFDAQHRFTNHQLFMYCEMQENTTDEDVIYQFLKLNFTGVPQSKEHIEFVRSLQERV